MWEQSKAAKRRYYDGAFHGRYFVGNGVDIGGKPDPLAQYIGIFPRMQSVRTWDLEDGDAQYMKGVADNTFDFLHASHSLEHMKDVNEALLNWTRVVKPGGFIIVTVPDEDLYERGHWPSRSNPDHKWTFTMCKVKSWSPRSINLTDLAQRFAKRLELERLILQRDFFRDQLIHRDVDQTMTPVAECALEVIWRKRVEAAPAQGQTPGQPEGLG
jgi:predicted SAM-dependent methyltransferase